MSLTRTALANIDIYQTTSNRFVGKLYHRQLVLYNSTYQEANPTYFKLDLVEPTAWVQLKQTLEYYDGAPLFSPQLLESENEWLQQRLINTMDC